MSMSRKDFADLAQIIATERAYISKDYADVGEYAVKANKASLDRIANEIASICAKRNERFDRAKFLDACQPSSASTPRKKVA